MDSTKRACMIESEEEDEDGNLSSAGSDSDEDYKVENHSEDISNASSAGNENSMNENDESESDEGENSMGGNDKGENSMGENDEGENSMGQNDEGENLMGENLSEDNSKSSSAKGNTSLEKEVVCSSNDSSSIQTGAKDKTNSFDEDGINSLQKTQNQVRKAKPPSKKVYKSKNLRTGPTKKISKKRAKSVSSEENSDSSSNESVIPNHTNNIKFARQPTPLCDAIMRDHAASMQNTAHLLGKRVLRGSKSNNNSKNQSEDLLSVDKVAPNLLLLHEIKTDLTDTDPTATDPLVVKKEEDDIELHIKEEIEVSDENKEDIKLFSIEDLMDCDKSQDILRKDQNLIEDNNPRQCNIQNKRKRGKRKNDEDGDPSYTPKTKRKFTESRTKNRMSQQEETCVPNKALSEINDAVIGTKTQRKPTKCRVSQAEINQESEINVQTDEQLTIEKDITVSVSKPSSGPVSIQRISFDPNSPSMQPVISLTPCDLLVGQLKAPKKRGRLPKANNAIILNICKDETEVESIVPLLDSESDQNSELTKKEENETVDIIQQENNPDPIPDFITPTINQENIFVKNDLLCLQQLDTPLTSSTTVQMEAVMSEKETNSFIADYLTSHQSVFEDSFFQNILPVLSEVLMLCMDEFTALLVRNKKAEQFTSEELRHQEVKLAVQSFRTMVSTYSEKFFPNFNSVMYKIDQNKTKKGLIIALILFLSNSVVAKAPQFKGQIHIFRRMLMCMCQISQINSPLFLAVLIIPEEIFNNELRLLVKILLVLQKNQVLAIPTIALTESSSSSIEETCESIIIESTSRSGVIDSTSKQFLAQFLKTLQEEHPEQGSSDLDSLFESYLKLSSTTNSVKTELAVDYDNPMKVEEDHFIPENGELDPECCEQDPLSF